MQPPEIVRRRVPVAGNCGWTTVTAACLSSRISATCLISPVCSKRRSCHAHLWNPPLRTHCRRPHLSPLAPRPRAHLVLTYRPHLDTCTVCRRVLLASSTSHLASRRRLRSYTSNQLLVPFRCLTETDFSSCRRVPLSESNVCTVTRGLQEAAIDVFSVFSLFSALIQVYSIHSWTSQ